MPYKLSGEGGDRVIHFFRDVDGFSESCPQFMLDDFAPGCYVEEPYWPARFLLRLAVRFHHLWATFGIRQGGATVRGSQPAVCFSAFNLGDLVAIQAGSAASNQSVTKYAITFSARSAESGGAKPVIRSKDLRSALHKECGSSSVRDIDIIGNQFRHVPNEHDSMSDQVAEAEWRWPYTGNYRRSTAKIEADGLEGNSIPGLNVSDKNWGGIGIVVATRGDAIRLRYDILSLIDRGLVSPNHFDHILVCDQLPLTLEGMAEAEVQQAFNDACFDFKAATNVSDEAAAAAVKNFSAKLKALENSSPRGQVQEVGGCWVCFDDNAHPYVRALLKAGRVEVNKVGRYLGKLDELDRLRDLGERQKIVKTLCKQIQDEHGIGCGYYSVRNSWKADELPFYMGRPFRGLYRITDEPDDDDE